MVKLQLDKWFKRPEETEGYKMVVEIPVNEIKPSPYQTRTEFDENELRELAESIQEFGVIQPVVVRRTEGGYELVAGERRVRASRIAGIMYVPAIIMDLEDKTAAAITLLENVQRSELNYLEEAEAYSMLMADFGYTQEELAQKLGKSQSAIANKIRLLRLPPEVRRRIRVDKVTERHARALLSLKSEEEQLEVLQTVIEKELTVRETENLVRRYLQNEQATAPRDIESLKPDLKGLRSYINSIKEIVYKARENGINMVCLENETEDGYVLNIKIIEDR